jgi:putative mRNA 3-end processing factor
MEIKTEMHLLQFSSSSIYCPLANIHIDPWKVVDFAILTHAHSDHARPGIKHYLAHKDSETILRLRLGNDISLQTVEYGEVFYHKGVKFSLHPAGHILGSAQVRVEHKGEVWVASGDYKGQNDGFCQAFEPIKCHSFITESTFGLPIYHWKKQAEVIQEIRNWIEGNRLAGKNSVLMGYALGKMQRLITGLQPFDFPVFAHGAIYAVNEALRVAGYPLPYIPLITPDLPKKTYDKALILAPGSALNTAWMNRFEPFSTGYCSGWMAVRGAKNRMPIDRGFVLSDHADWPELNTLIKATEAENVYVTHGFTSSFAKWLNENGMQAKEVKTMYGEESANDFEPTPSDKA